MAHLTAGRKVLVLNLSLQYGDYRNLPGEVLEVNGDSAMVAIPRNKFSSEDLRELRKDGDNALLRVKLSNLA